jgi:pimeloyl-ACP methyl ester carboxylesterase
MLRDAKAPPDDVRNAMRLIDLYFDVRLRRAKWEELEKALAAAKGTTYDRYVFHPKSEAEILADLEDYDPAPVLSSLRVPLLALYGELDPAVTPAANVARMKRYLRYANNRASTVKVFPGADHDFFEARKPYVQRDRYVPGYLQTIVSWIEARTR